MYWQIYIEETNYLYKKNNGNRYKIQRQSKSKEERS